MKGLESANPQTTGGGQAARGWGVEEEKGAVASRYGVPFWDEENVLELLMVVAVQL